MSSFFLKLILVYWFNVSARGGNIPTPPSLNCPLLFDVFGAQAAHLTDTLLNSVQNSVMITNMEGHILWVNRTFLTVTGYAFEEVVGKTPNILKSGLQSQSFYENLWKTVRRGAVWQGEMVNRKKDGSYWTQGLTIYPIGIAGENAEYFVAVARDITHIRQLELAVSDKTHELERMRVVLDRIHNDEAFRVIGQSTSRLHHDIGNLLTPVAGYAELALLQTDPSNPIYRMLQEIVSSATRMADLISMVRSVARNEARAVVLDPNKSIQTALPLLKGLLTSSSSIDLELRSAVKDARIQISEKVLMLILSNLVVNARNAIGNRVGGKIELTVNSAHLGIACPYQRRNETLEIAPGDYFVIEVKDNGCGIASENLAKIFHEFFTTSQQGTGMGLTNVERYMNEAGGHVTFRTEVGVGTVFSLFFPAVQCDNCFP